MTTHGFAGYRAIVRWTWRLLLRERRQQLLVLALLTFAVTAAVVGVAVGHAADAGTDAGFGSATGRLVFDGSRPRTLSADIDATRRWFGPIDVVGHRWVSVAGSVERIDVRDESPSAPYVAPMLALADGRWPQRADEVALTDGLMRQLGLRLDASVDLGGRRHRVVGVVENPQELSDAFALVPPGSDGPPQSVTVLVRATTQRFDAFRQSPRGVAADGRSALVGYEARPGAGPRHPLPMLAAGCALLMLVGLVSAAGFTVISQRRLRQLGMLGAIGAAGSHVRLVLLANGAFVGIAAAALGTAAGLALWAGISASLEPAVDHRVDVLALPWGLILAIALLAPIAAVASAWWPGRAAARVPVVLALAARTPRPGRARASTLLAAVLITAGLGCLALADRSRPPLVAVGVLATLCGVLLMGPPAIASLAVIGRRCPVATRLALRDLARYQTRSAAALAAITLGLGITVAVVIIATAQARKQASEPPNLSSDQVRVYEGPAASPDFSPVHATLAPVAESAAVGVVARSVGGATTTALMAAAEPGVAPELRGDTRGVTALEVAHHAGGSDQTVSFLYVATPAVLGWLGINPSAIDPQTDFLAATTLATNGTVIPSETRRREYPLTHVQRIDTPRLLLGDPSGDSGLEPPTFITPEGLRRRGWHEIPSGWLIQARRPLGTGMVAAARRAAADGGLAIETRRSNDSFSTLTFGATAAGALLGFGILALAVSLVRSEAASDMRTLAATGAPGTTRRMLTASTAGALALLGVLLAVAGTYLILTAVYVGDLGYLGRPPVRQLAITIVGMPVAAAAAGWLVAGREPASITGQTLD